MIDSHGPWTPSQDLHHKIQSFFGIYRFHIKRKQLSILKHLIPMNPMDPALLLKLVTVQMPYGKHAGRLLADLPGNYLNWFAREGFPPGELGRLLALMQTIDHNGLRDLLRPLRA
jgi:uncharacterized protein (DUF3820 family)